YALNGITGEVLDGWPFVIDNFTFTANGTFPSPAVADLVGDDRLEVVIADGFGEIWVLNADGTVVWVKQAFGQTLFSSPVLADVHGERTPCVILTGGSIVRAFSGINGAQLFEHSNGGEYYTSS